MSLVTPPNGQDLDDLDELPVADQRPLAEVLAAITVGPVRATDVARLSDLSRDELKLVTAAWRNLDEATRVSLVREMTELAEARVELLFGRVLRLALSDPSAVVRQLAIPALWEDESPAFAEALLQMLIIDPSPDVRAEAAQALAPFVDEIEAEMLDETLAQDIRDRLLDAATDYDLSPVIRRRALESVGALAGDEAVREAIETAYGADDQALQASALHAMGRSQSTFWLEILLAELNGHEPELRYEAARACGRISSEEAVPDLAALGDDDDLEVRHAAIAALGLIGGRHATRVLENLAEVATEQENEVDAELIADALADAQEAADLPNLGL